MLQTHNKFTHSKILCTLRNLISVNSGIRISNFTVVWEGQRRVKNLCHLMLCRFLQKKIIIVEQWEEIQGVRHWNVFFEMVSVTILLDLQTCSDDFYIAEGRYFDIPASPLQKKLIKWQNFSFEKKILIFFGSKIFLKFFKKKFFAINQPKKGF